MSTALPRLSSNSFWRADEMVEEEEEVEMSVLVLVEVVVVVESARRGCLCTNSLSAGRARRKVCASTRFRIRLDNMAGALVLVLGVKASGGEELAAEERRARAVITEVVRSCIFLFLFLLFAFVLVSVLFIQFNTRCYRCFQLILLIEILWWVLWLCLLGWLWCYESRGSRHELASCRRMLSIFFALVVLSSLLLTGFCCSFVPLKQIQSTAEFV